MVIGTTLMIILVASLAIWILIELQRFKHKLFAIFLIGLLIFSYVSASYLFKDKGIDFKSPSGWLDASKIYFTWLGSVFKNLMSITTQATKLDWKNGNSTVVKK